MDGHTLSLRSLAYLSKRPRMVFSPRGSADNDDDDPESSSTSPQNLTVATTVTVTVPTVTVTAAPTPYQDKYEHDGDRNATGTTILASPTPSDPPSLSSLKDHGNGLPSTLQTGSEKAGLIAGVIVAGFAATFLLVLLAMRRRYGASLTRWPYFNRWRGKRTPSLNDGSSYGFRTGQKWLMLGDGDEKGESWAVTGGQADSMTRKPSTSFRPHFSPLQSPRSSMVTDREEKTARAVPITRLPFRTERLTTRRNKEQSPDGDQSAEADENEKQSSSTPPPPRRIRGPGISYFSWSTTTTPATPASALLLPSNGNQRETMLTDDSEPPRFRSIYSWVNNQSKRQQRGQTGGDGGDAPPIIPSITRNNNNKKKNMYPLYPPTPPIPHAPPGEEENRRDSGLIQPERSDSKPIDHKRMRSSTTTAATLPIFRQHPGEEVDLGESKVGRIRSSSLHRLLMR